MGYIELIDSLRKEEDNKIRSIQADAESEAEKVRKETSDKIRLLRDEHGKKLAKAAGNAAENILKKADNRAYSIRLHAENVLSDRLYKSAMSSLVELRGTNNGYSFKKFVTELPEAEWASITVSPEDINSAKELFPNAEIKPDRNISGGLEALSKNGKINVINTLEKRLERAWMQLLPELIKDIYNGK